MWRHVRFSPTPAEPFGYAMGPCGPSQPLSGSLRRVRRLGSHEAVVALSVRTMLHAYSNGKIWF